MYATGLSDLSSMLRMQRFGTSTRSEMNDTGYEVASGKKADLVGATHGDLSPLFALEKTLGRLSQRAGAITTASAKAAASQLHLQSIQSRTAQYGVDLLAAVDLEDRHLAFATANSARSDFNAMVASLNSQYAGQSLFAGAAADRPALIDGDAMYAQISALTAAAPDAVSVITAIDDYFNDPAGGFATSAFQGSLLDAAGVETAPGDVVTYAVRADTDGIRAALQSVALAAVAANGDHGGTDLDGMVILREAANTSIAAVDGMVDIREGLGHVEEQLDLASAQNAAQKNTFEINRNAIVAADPYEAATRFKALEGQMEAVYMMTSRLSGMRLQNYLR